jgi:hypothetical protein
VRFSMYKERGASPALGEEDLATAIAHTPRSDGSLSDGGRVPAEARLICFRDVGGDVGKSAKSTVST